MTRAVQVATAGFKSGSQPDMVYDLGAQTLVVGAPGAGKTRLLQAMQYAALGYVPSLGKAESETAALMHGERLSVRVTLDDGRWFERSLTRKGDRLQNGAACSWADGTQSRIDREIVQLFGATDVDAAECVAIGALLSLPPTQMAMRVENVLAATCMTTVQMLAAVRAAVAERVDADAGAAASRPAVYERILAEAMEATDRRMMSGGITSVIAHSATQMQAARAAAASKVKARSVLEDRLREMQTPAVARSVLDAERVELVRRLQTVRVLSEQGAAWRRRVSEDAGKRLESARHEVASLGGSDKASSQIALWRAEAGRCDEELRTLKVPDPPAVGDAEAATEAEHAEMQRLRALVQDYKDREPVQPVIPVLPDTLRARKALETAQQWLQSVEQSEGVVVEQACANIEVAVRQSHAFDPGAVLADLGALLLDGVQRIRAAVGDRDVRVLENARQQCSAAQAELDAVQQKCDLASAASDKEHAEWRKAHERWRLGRFPVEDAERRLQEMERSNDARVLEAAEKAAAVRGRWMIEADGVRRKQAALVVRRDELLRAASAREKDLAAAMQRLGEAEASHREILASQPAEAENAEPLDARLREVEADLKALDGFAALAAEMRVLVDQIEEADAASVVWSAVGAAAKRVRDADLQNRGGPIVAGMTTFLRAAGRTEIPFLRADGGRVALGWLVDGRERPIKALGGMEAVLVSAALGAALVALRGATLGWLLIDANEVGVQCFDALAAGCDAVGGGLGNVVVATNLPVSVPATWSRIDV